MNRIETLCDDCKALRESDKIELLNKCHVCGILVCDDCINLCGCGYLLCDPCFKVHYTICENRENFREWRKRIS
jgi:hypothetical protein